MLKFIDGGVCAAQGFRAGGIHVGVKTHAEWKKDMAMIVSDVDCACAAVYTKNVVKAAHIHVQPRSTAATPTPVPPTGRRTRSGSALPPPRPSAVPPKMWSALPPASSVRP